MVYEEDLEKQNWQIAPGLERNHTELKGLSGEEQEVHIHIDPTNAKEGLPEVNVCCSVGSWITKLAKNPQFCLRKCLISRQKAVGGHHLMEVWGTFEYASSSISLRSKKRIVAELTTTQKAQLAKMREARAKKQP